MAEQKQPKTEIKQEAKVDVAPATEKVKTETKVEVKKKAITEASAKGIDLHISTKQGMAICDMIRGKDVDTALKMLEEVLTYKRVVEMNNRQVGHRHGKGIMAGRYPINCTHEFIRMLKQLKANAMHNELEIENNIIFGMTNKAGGTWKSGGRRAKRSNVLLKLILNTKNTKKQQTKKGVKK